MWFLQISMLFKMILGVVLFLAVDVICRKKNKPRVSNLFLFCLNIYIIFSASWGLCLFYLAYVALTYLLVVLMGKINRRKKYFFGIFCLLCASVFFYSRLSGIIMIIGFSYNMLKAIDAIFWVYYTGEGVSPLTYANYMLYFPVFTAGPIFRYRDFIKTYNNKNRLTSEVVEANLKRFIRGLFFKLVVVTLLTIFFEKLTSLGYYRWYISILTIIISYFILFFDLFGYSDMAISIGGFMGISVPENFKNPFSAASFTQFWRKWHVTLSDWIRDHIFVVVQGKRLNRYQAALIGFVTMLVMSVWYDFSLVIIGTGAYMGICLAIENIFNLSTCSIKKNGKFQFYLRCLIVNFLFAINTLAYFLPGSQIFEVLKGLFKI